MLKGNFLYSTSCRLLLVLSVDATKKSLASSSALPPQTSRVFIHTGKIPLNLLFSGLSNQLSQPLLIQGSSPLTTSVALCKTLQHVHVSLTLGSPELDAAPRWVSPGRAEGKDHFPQPGLILLRMSSTFFTTRRSGGLRSVWCPPGLRVDSGKLLPSQSARTAAWGCLSSAHSYTECKNSSSCSVYANILS